MTDQPGATKDGVCPVAVEERTDDCRRYHLGDRDPGQLIRPNEALA
jgi:hypothetical protein